jgi:predicted RNA-binding protein with PIN domain
VPVPVIVDGYNLLHALGEEPGAESRDRLVTDLVRWARARGRKVVLVFDAQKGGAREAREIARGAVTVHFTRAGELADQFIVRWVTARPEVVVVSSDREVQRSVSRRGAAVLDAESFAARLEGDGTDDSLTPAARRPRARGAQAAWLRGL